MIHAHQVLVLSHEYSVGEYVADHSALPRQPIFMAEGWQLCTCNKYHKHKLILYLAAMRHHCDRLAFNRNRNIIYLSLN